MARRTSDRWLAAAALVMGLGLGYGLSWADGHRALRTTVRVGDESFSEADALKQDLMELCRHQVFALRDAAGNPGAAGEARRLRTDPEAVARVRSLIAEYSGTAPEAEFTQVLMIMLWRSGEFDRWLDEYFGMVYRHPTWVSVGVDWVRASELACGLGRMEEWERARVHLKAIPSSAIGEAYRPEELRRGTGDR